MSYWKNRWRDTPPCDQYDIPAMEAWLAEQAGRGRELTDWLRFRDSIPCNCRFFLEPSMQGEYKPTEEKQEAYGEAGWEYVCSTDGELFLVWRSTCPDPAPLQTDPAADSYAYTGLWKRAKRRTVWRLLGLAAVAAFLVLLTAEDGYLLLTMVRSPGVAWSMLYGLLAILAFGLLALWDLRTLRRLLDGLRTGFPMPERRPKRRRKLLVSVISGVFSVYLLVYLAISWITLDDGGYGVTYEENPVPYIAAEALRVETDKQVTVKQTRTLLGGEVCVVYQGDSGIVWGSDSVPVSPVWDILRIVRDVQQEVYTPRLGFLAKPMVRELAKAYIPEETGEEAKPLETECFEEAYYLRDSNGVQHLAACLNGRALYFRANAPGDLREYLAELAALLTEVS